MAKQPGSKQAEEEQKATIQSLQAENLFLRSTLNRCKKDSGLDKVPEEEMAMAIQWVLKEKAAWNAHLRETYQKYQVLKIAYEALDQKEKDATANWKRERES